MYPEALFSGSYDLLTPLADGLALYSELSGADKEGPETIYGVSVTFI